MLQFYPKSYSKVFYFGCLKKVIPKLMNDYYAKVVIISQIFLGYWNKRFYNLRTTAKIRSFVLRDNRQHVKSMCKTLCKTLNSLCITRGQERPACLKLWHSPIKNICSVQSFRQDNRQLSKYVQNFEQPVQNFSNVCSIT